MRHGIAPGGWLTPPSGIALLWHPAYVGLTWFGPLHWAVRSAAYKRAFLYVLGDELAYERTFKRDCLQIGARESIRDDRPPGYQGNERMLV